MASSAEHVCCIGCGDGSSTCSSGYQLGYFDRRVEVGSRRLTLCLPWSAASAIAKTSSARCSTLLSAYHQSRYFTLHCVDLSSRLSSIEPADPSLPLETILAFSALTSCSQTALCSSNALFS